MKTDNEPTFLAKQICRMLIKLDLINPNVFKNEIYLSNVIDKAGCLRELLEAANQISVSNYIERKIKIHAESIETY